MDCPDCSDRGTVAGCSCCGRTRPETAQDREYAEWDRQDAIARDAAPSYAKARRFGR